MILLDDLGYVQQSPDEAEVLFTLLAERYERRSVMVTSNLVFSQWDRISRDQMATAAAIDRLVHHSVVLEFDVPSYRTDPSRHPAPPPSPPQRLVDGHRVPCCRGVAEPCPPEPRRSEKSRASEGYPATGRERDATEPICAAFASSK